MKKGIKKRKPPPFLLPQYKKRRKKKTLTCTPLPLKSKRNF